MADAPTPPLSGRDAKKQAKADLAAAKARAKAERPLWKKPLFWVGAIIALFIVAGIAGSGQQTTTPSVESPVADDSDDATEVEEPAEEEPAEEEPDLTSGQENAVRSAEQYLDISGYSREGLIEQLEFEGYSTKDAAFAADYLNVDWNEQAARSAEQYLDISGYSRSGLIEQLEFEGYTPKQAAYGADKAL